MEVKVDIAGVCETSIVPNWPLVKFIIFPLKDTPLGPIALEVISLNSSILFTTWYLYILSTQSVNANSKPSNLIISLSIKTYPEYIVPHWPCTKISPKTSIYSVSPAHNFCERVALPKRISSCGPHKSLVALSTLAT